MSGSGAYLSTREGGETGHGNEDKHEQQGHRQTTRHTKCSGPEAHAAHRRQDSRSVRSASATTLRRRA